MLLTNNDRHVAPAAFAERTGWELKPEGACKGPVCVPMPAEAWVDGVAGGSIDLDVIAPKLGMPIVVDERSGMTAVGPESLGGKALTTAEAPDLTLTDMVTGEAFSLSSLRGTKVAIISWAPW